jgi:hypothetical protein
VLCLPSPAEQAPSARRAAAYGSGASGANPVRDEWREEADGIRVAPWYVGAALRRATANLCACAAATAAAVALGACGGGERRDADAPGGTYTVRVERSSFPAQQRLAKAAALILTVRNTGEKAIPDLVVTVRGFQDRAGGSRDADLGRDVWIVDDGPGSAATAFEDTWTAGRLAPGRSATLRWNVTPVISGTHTVRYEIGPTLAGAARARLANGGRPTGALRVRISGEPARARVDPRSGAVLRDE